MAREAGSPGPAPSASCRPRRAQFAVHREVPRPRSAACSRRSRPRLSRSAGRGPRSCCGPARPAGAPTPPSASPPRSPRVLVSGSLRDRHDRRPSGARPDQGDRRARSTAPGAVGDAAAAPPDPLTPEAAARRAAGQPRRIPGDAGPRAPRAPTPRGNGLVFTCQGGRYADHARHRRPGADVHRHAANDREGQGGAASPAVQAAEAVGRRGAPPSAPTRPRSDWYAGCTTTRVQLLATTACRGVGDEATLLVLRTWADPVTTQVVGVARTGGLTTTVVNTVTGMTDPDDGAGPEPSAGLLAAAVSGLCALPDAGNCAGRRSSRTPRRSRSGRHPACWSRPTCRPVPTHRRSRGSAPSRRKAEDNVAATQCDNTDFSRPGHHQGADPDVRDPGGDAAAARVRPLRDRRRAARARQAHAFVERHPRQARPRCPSDERPRHRASSQDRRGRQSVPPMARSHGLASVTVEVVRRHRDLPDAASPAVATAIAARAARARRRRLDGFVPTSERSSS